MKIAMGAVLVLSGCSDQDDVERAEELVIPVEVEAVREGALTTEETFYGKVSPNQMTSIIPMTAGEISELAVANGDEVQTGDVIARINPGNVVVEAPHGGAIHQLSIQEGSKVSNQNPIGAVIDLDDVKITFHATAEQLDLFKEGQDIKVTVKDKAKMATVHYISVTPDDTGLYPIEASLSNPNHVVKPGMIAEAQMSVSEIDHAIIVPTTSIVEEKDNTYIFIIENDTAKRIPITILQTQTEKTAIDGDVQVGDQVVTKGQLTLEDGAQVEVMKEEG